MTPRMVASSSDQTASPTIVRGTSQPAGPSGRPEPLRHQPPRRRELIGVAEGADRRAYLVGGDTPLAELGGERPAGEAPAVVPGLDPCLGERGVVDQPYLGEPAKDGLRDLVRHPATAQRAGELGPGARPGGQQPQADLAGRLLRVYTAVTGASRCCPARCCPARPPGARGAGPPGAYRAGLRVRRARSSRRPVTRHRRGRQGHQPGWRPTVRPAPPRGPRSGSRPSPARHRRLGPHPGAGPRQASP